MISPFKDLLSRGRSHFRDVPKVLKSPPIGNLNLPEIRLSVGTKRLKSLKHEQKRF